MTISAPIKTLQPTNFSASLLGDAPFQQKQQTLDYDDAQLGRTHITLILSTAQDNQQISCRLTSDVLAVALQVYYADNDYRLRFRTLPKSMVKTGYLQRAIFIAVDAIFCSDSSLQQLKVDSALRDCLPSELFSNNQLKREVFYQWPVAWLTRTSVPKAVITDTVSTTTDNGVILHPRRAPQPKGEVYRRFISIIDQTLSFRVIDPVKDLDLFHDWMNQRRVAKMWELNKSKKELGEYLQDREKDPHIFGVIGEFNGVPFGYFEIYWTAEDRLGHYYDAEPHDRGFHLLVGNTQYLGKQFFHAWFTGLSHYIFLSDARTARIMGEPRADNKGLLQYTQRLPAYQVLKEFDFPHKRAALVECARDRFFSQGTLL